MGGCFFVKKVEKGWGVFCKKWTFPQRRVHYVQYQYFYFTFYLFVRCVRTQRTPCLRAWRQTTVTPQHSAFLAGQEQVYTVSQKTRHLTLAHNFTEY